MSLLMPKDSNHDFESVPAGTFIATCYRVIDIGTQQIEWAGKVKRQKKILLSWELTEEKMTDGLPFSIHKRYTLSSSDKAALRIDLESWRGVPFKDEDFGSFDIGNLLGKSCLMGVVQETKNGKTYSNISSILRLHKGMTPQPLVNQTVRFDLSNFDQTVYESFSDNLRLTISKSPEYQELKGIKTDEHIQDDGRPTPPDDAIPADLNDSIPF